MSERILYVYAGTSATPPYDQTGMNFTALVKNGEVVDKTAGLDDDRIASEVARAYANRATISLNQHPEGEELTARLNPDLENRLKGIIGGIK